MHGSASDPEPEIPPSWPGAGAPGLENIAFYGGQYNTKSKFQTAKEEAISSHRDYFTPRAGAGQDNLHQGVSCVDSKNYLYLTKVPISHKPFIYEARESSKL